MAFTTSQAGIDLIKSFEDCRLTAYQDSVGVWTIGYGHTNGVYAGMTITQAQAEEFLRSDLKTAENAVNGKVTYPIVKIAVLAHTARSTRAILPKQESHLAGWLN